ncbi:unnamed protein product [Anisakis simplex]|uniref:CCR4-NOT transcription complex subunit 1 (inferred by orthology to a human protein) n=1 Tax=Anisakis simplex TaxID=6269 RepID=A0A0M3K6W9_ANISI|nr:unnamed protein product [Anisakis simplex]
MQMEMEWSRRLKDVFISVCRIILTQFSLPDLARRITRVIVDCRLEYRFNVDAIDLMVKHALIQMNLYDQHLALLIDGGNNFEVRLFLLLVVSLCVTKRLSHVQATLFAQRLVKLSISGGSGARQQVLEGLPMTLEQLSKIQQYGQNRPTPTMERCSSFPSAMSNAVPHSESPVGGLPRTGSVIAPPQSSLADRTHAGNFGALGSSGLHPGAANAGVGGGRGEESQVDTQIPELQSKVEMILREWIQLCYTPMAQKEPQQALATIVHVMHDQGVLQTDEMITRFFRLCTEMCVDVSYRLLKNESHVHQATVVRQRCYYTLDAFVKLTCIWSDCNRASSRGKIGLGGPEVDSLVEMTQEPKMHVNMATIIPVDLRARLDDYLATRSSVDFHASLPAMLQVSNIPGAKYNTTVMNAVVLYVGMRAIQAIQEKQQCITMSTIAHTAYMDIFQNLAVSLCTEGRYLLFNAIANQLRYPNSHTHYFSCTLLYLFLEANTEVIQEQITRILFERLVALRPHPWGLLITFIELIKNPSYGFWKHEFVRCAPEIERLFQSVANSCIGSNNARNANITAAQRPSAQSGGVGSARSSPAPSSVGNI